MNYSLDNRLQQATLPIGRLELCEIRLLNDARWPWLLLVPMRDGMSEIFDLSATEQITLTRETVLTSVALKKLARAEKINSAAIGNIVRQLHVHVIARNENDANWPGPVWGFGQAEPYARKAADKLTSKLQNELNI